MSLILSIALIHLLACLSPGPDIFLVVRTSIRHGWRTALATTAGILTGVCLQITFGLSGITYLVSRNEALATGISLLGATWLLYIGLKGLFQKLKKSGSQVEAPEVQQTNKSAWLEGLLVNLLNPKALLFFLGVFSVFLGPEVPLSIKVLSGATMIVVQAVAFSLVAFLASRPLFNARWPTLQIWMDHGISFILISIGLWIWLKNLLSLTA